MHARRHQTNDENIVGEMTALVGKKGHTFSSSEVERMNHFKYLTSQLAVRATLLVSAVARVGCFFVQSCNPIAVKNREWPSRFGFRSRRSSWRSTTTTL
jgi:hypothetical protein